MVKRCRAMIGAMLAVSLVAPVSAISAENYPSRAVTVVVPFPPGGGTDILGRVVAEELAKTFAQPFVVMNRPGAAGTIGSTQVSRSAPDGYTLLVAATGALMPPGQVSASTYDVKKDFAPISGGCAALSACRECRRAGAKRPGTCVACKEATEQIAFCIFGLRVGVASGGGALQVDDGRGHRTRSL